MCNTHKGQMFIFKLLFTFNLKQTQKLTKLVSCVIFGLS